MKKRSLGKGGLEVSALGFGCMVGLPGRRSAYIRNASEMHCVMRAGGGPYRQFSYRQRIPNARVPPAREVRILGSWLAEKLCFWRLTRIETGVIQRDGIKAERTRLQIRCKLRGWSTTLLLIHFRPCLDAARPRERGP